MMALRNWYKQCLSLGLILTLLSFFPEHVLSQTVDKVRLGYDSAQAKSTQIGIAVSHNGIYIAFAYQDNTVKIFNIEINKFVARFNFPLFNLFDFKLSSDGQRIIFVSDSSLRIYDWKSERILQEVTLPNVATRSTFLGGKDIIAIGMEGGHVSIYNVDSLHLIASLQTEGKHVSVLDLSPDGKRVVVGSITKLRKYPLFLYDINTGNLIAQSKEEIYTAAFFDSSGEKIVTTGLKIKRPAAKIVTASIYIPASVFALLFVGQKCPEGEPFGPFGAMSFEDCGTSGIGIVVAAIATGAYGIWRAFRSKTFIRTLSAQDLSLEKEVSKKAQFASIKYYQQGVAEGDLALMLTHTQAFDVYDLSTSKKVFTTTQEETSYKASIDLIGNDVERIYRFGNTSKYLINTYQNNINQIYDSKKNLIVGYLYSDSNEDFAVVSRDGRIDGTQSSLSKIFWTSKNSKRKTYLEANFESGYTPRLLSEIINDVNFTSVEFDIDKILAKVPVVRIFSVDGQPVQTVSSVASSKKKIQITFEITENNQEVKEVRLFQNAKLVSVQSVQDTSLYTFEVNLTNAFGEENYFYAIAQSKSGLESAKSKLIVRYDGISEDPPKLFLVTIGINEYLNPKYNLNYAVADADGVEQAIKNNSSSLFKEIFTYSLRNDKAINSNLKNVIEEIQSMAKEQDVLIFYFAGHGVVSETDFRESEFYLVPYDVTQLYGNEDLLIDRAISSSQLKNISTSINAQKQIFILDACQSAGALVKIVRRGIEEEKAIAQLARSTGTFWITSTGSNQFATEFEELGHGVFTYALIDGLNGSADTNKDGKLTIRELTTFVENLVPELAEKYKGSLQFPAVYSYGNDFPIALFK